MLSFVLMVIRNGLKGGRTDTDEALMELYQDGDVASFEILLQRYERKIFNYIYRHVQHRERANDLLQETFLRLIRSQNRYDPKAKFSTWLYTIARNVCIDELRKMKLRRHKSFEQPISSKGEGWAIKDTIAGSRDDGFRGTDSREIRERLETAVAELPDEQREVFVMRAIMSMRFKEISEVVGVSEGTVKSRMRYALEALRLQLADYAVEMPSAVDPVPARSKV